MSVLETIKTFMTALQSGDMELAAKTMADDFTLRGMAPQTIHKDELLAIQSQLVAAMPDFSYNLSELHRTGEYSQGLIQVQGTQTNDLSLPMFGLGMIPASGLALVLPQVEVVYRVDDEKVMSMNVEQVPGGGLMGLVQQLGSELPLPERERTMADPRYPEQEETVQDIDQ